MDQPMAVDCALSIYAARRPERASRAAARVGTSAGPASQRLWYAGWLVGLALIASFWVSGFRGTPVDPVPVSVSGVGLVQRPDAYELRVAFVDESGTDVALRGTLAYSLRQRDGLPFERALTLSERPTYFSDGPLRGRWGYRVAVPTGAWLAAPQPGGTLTVRLQAQPGSGTEILATTNLVVSAG